MLCNKQLQNLEGLQQKSLFLCSHKAADDLGSAALDEEVLKSAGLSSRLWLTPYVSHPPSTSDNPGNVLLLKNSWCTSQTTCADFKSLLTLTH